MSAQFVGRGWSFPLRFSDSGGIGLVERDEEIVQAIELILRTPVGERPMRPEFGCRVHEHVFAPADATTAGLIAYDVAEALERWEPRIDVHDIDVDVDPDDSSRMLIDIEWSVRRSNDRRNLVFPFYVIPSEV